MDGEMLLDFDFEYTFVILSGFLDFFGMGRVEKRLDFGNTIFIVYLSKLLGFWVFVFYYLFLERMKRVEYFGNIYIMLSGGIWIFLDFLFVVAIFADDARRMKGIGMNTLDLYATFIVLAFKFLSFCHYLRTFFEDGGIESNTLNFLLVFSL